MFKPKQLLLFIGDSITHAHRRPEEYHDCYYLGGGYANHVAGALGLRHPQWRLRFANRGECGHNVANLAQRWERDCLALKPDVVSILIGINDSNPKLNQPVADYERNYRDILDRTRGALPGTKFILIEPFGFAVPKPRVPIDAISAAQLERLPARQAVVKRLAGEYQAVFVPTQEAFHAGIKLSAPEHYSLDGVHPSVAGHALIAQQWLQACLG